MRAIFSVAVCVLWALFADTADAQQRARRQRDGRKAADILAGPGIDAVQQARVVRPTPPFVHQYALTQGDGCGFHHLCWSSRNGFWSGLGARCAGGKDQANEDEDERNTFRNTGNHGRIEKRDPWIMRGALINGRFGRFCNK